MGRSYPPVTERHCFIRHEQPTSPLRQGPFQLPIAFSDLRFTRCSLLHLWIKIFSALNVNYLFRGRPLVGRRFL